MIEIAGLVVAGVTALGTVVQAFYTARAKNRRVNRANLKKGTPGKAATARANEKAAKAAKAAEAAAAPAEEEEAAE